MSSWWGMVSGMNETNPLNRWLWYWFDVQPAAWVVGREDFNVYSYHMSSSILQRWFGSLDTVSQARQTEFLHGAPVWTTWTLTSSTSSFFLFFLTVGPTYKLVCSSTYSAELRTGDRDEQTRHQRSDDGDIHNSAAAYLLHPASKPGSQRVLTSKPSPLTPTLEMLQEASFFYLSIYKHLDTFLMWSTECEL